MQVCFLYSSKPRNNNFMRIEKPKFMDKTINENEKISKILAYLGDKIILLKITPAKVIDNQLHFKFTKAIQ